MVTALLSLSLSVGAGGSDTRIVVLPMAPLIGESGAAAPRLPLPRRRLEHRADATRNAR